MRSQRHHLSTVLLLTVAGCSSEHLDGNDFLLASSAAPTGSEGSITVGGSVPAWAGNVRVKLNGRYLASGGGDHRLTYLEISGGYHAFVGTTLPAGATELELVNRAGQTLLPAQSFNVPALGAATVWVHDSPSGLVAEPAPDLDADDDPTTSEAHVLNISPSDRVIVSRCAGQLNCDCSVSQVSPADCNVLTTVAPGETWSTKPPTTHIDPVPGFGAACLAVQLEGQATGPECVIQLDSHSPSFHDVAYLIIDGLAPTTFQNPDGSTIGRLPGMLPFP